MADLKVLVPATCPHCSSKKTARGGYLPAEGGSVWKCRNPECAKSFTVKTLIFQKAP
jgi:transposase-like protein